jgi:acetyl-CoA carboxylase carboxyltransferase component
MMTLRDKSEALARLRAGALQMGGALRVARQHDKKKMDARQRLAALLDEGSLDELGLLARHEGALAAEEEDSERPTPADGVICGVGDIDGRPVAVAAYDFTVFGGSIGPVGEAKVARLRDIALKCRIPMVWLVDSAGARIDAGGAGAGVELGKRLSQFADTGYLFREQVIMSGVVPQVAAMLGPGAAGTAYIPALADFVPMVRGTSSMAIGGPYLVESTVGERVSEEELGGAKVHCRVSGCADVELPDDQACLHAIKEYLSFFPSHCGERPPRAPCVDPIGRRDDAILDVIPENPRQPYDMCDVLVHVVDDGRLFEIKARFAQNLVTALARIDGRPVGIVANNPKHLGGILDVDASDKAARFINICDAFSIPLVFMVDVPGFMVGTKVEAQGIIRHGAKMMYATATATVPKLTVVVRKAYGAGYYVMCGRAFEPDLLVAWPGAEIGVMGAEGLVSIGAHKLLEQADDKKAIIAELAQAIKPHIDILRTAALGLIDDVIDPRDTRRVLARALARTEHKVVERPQRRREISPV